ncbi:MAG: hypothetical protein TR69_WS6001000835 [candidate division WS6 bacterium OLB20]|uniref:Uncharacterized protein n=1 Tax=candidate division WS6 bacterium OLB20 TaxID=1617426 RepID=A0A136LYR6_9BACT|nr:MAG: hypothetical protein TR69_WS6001000835 [candidate division WS6 bacterium OLB20]
MSDGDILSTARQLTEELLTQLGLDADIAVDFSDSDTERGIRYVGVKLEGDNLNELIGHHGRNLESLQIILGMMLVKKLDTEENLRVLVEINDYRESREKIPALLCTACSRSGPRERSGDGTAAYETIRTPCGSHGVETRTGYCQ